MTKSIVIDLSTQSVNRAIRKLWKVVDEIEKGTAKLVEALTDEGAEVAQSAFGGSASVDKISDGSTGIIEASGDAVTIMEFGAGMATMEGHPLAGNAPHTIKQWEYSRTVGSGEGYLTGRWHFGGQVYTEVLPRHGMLDARDYIENNAVEKAKEVFG